MFDPPDFSFIVPSETGVNPRKLGPVEARATVQSGVYRQLRMALMTGYFEPEETLTIASLAQSFETSHMPAREALRQLAAEGAVEISRGGSARVPPVSRERLHDICRARRTLEGLATELAAARIDAAGLALLRRTLDAHAATANSDDVYAMLVKNQEFHFTLYALSGSAVLPPLIETLWLRFGPYMRMLTRHLEPALKAGKVGDLAVFHRKAVEALAAGRLIEARDAIQADISATEQLLETLCADEAPIKVSDAR